MSHLIGVFREPEFSPGRVEDDAAILERTRDALALHDIALTLGGPELLGHEAPTGILAMCQSAEALALLDRWSEVVPVVNSPQAIRGCYRHETVRRLAGSAVPFPASRLVATTGCDVTDAAPCWVKRGDVHAMTAGDVTFAPTAAAVHATLADLARRGVAQAMLQAHVPGVVVKFYGIVDGRFFRCFTDEPEIPAPLPRLWEAAHAGARTLGLEVFGGDLIVGDDGRPVVVDLNDWPSFSRCRDEAAEAIAAYTVDRMLDASASRPQGPHGSEART
jgi:hypothetical protein